jgi:hypothetical protein
VKVPEWLRYRPTGPMGPGLSRAAKWLGIGLIALGVLLLLTELGLRLLHPARPSAAGHDVLPLWRAGAGCVTVGIVVLVLWASAKQLQGR